jgi:hypothetical protein
LAKKTNDDDDFDLNTMIEENDDNYHCSLPPAKRIKLGKYF